MKRRVKAKGEPRVPNPFTSTSGAQPEGLSPSNGQVPPGNERLSRAMAEASSIDLLRARAQSREAGRSVAAAAAGKVSDTGARIGLAAIIAEMGAQEVAVLTLIARRLLEGQRTYGHIDVARDPRDFEVERGAELADVLVYGAFAELRRVLAKKKGAA